MGPIIAAVAIGIGIGGAIASKITSDMVQDLKRQINRIVNQHQDDSDRLKNLQSLLSKLDLGKVYEVMKKVSNKISGSFNTFLVDQQERMQYIQNVTLKEIDKQNLSGVLSNLLQMLNVISSVMSVVELAAATNPATIVVSGIMLVLNGILGIFSTISNIKAINQLKRNKQELLQYFKPGGQFQVAQIKLKQNAVQVIRNLYMLIVNGKNLLKMLSARISLLQLQGSKIDYSAPLRALQADPFDYGFQKLILDTYLNFVQIYNNKNLGLNAQITRIYTILDSLMKSQDIPKKLQQFTSIMSQFTEDQPIAKQIESEYQLFHQVSLERIASAKKFLQRQKKTPEQLQIYDQRLLKTINSQFLLPLGSNQNNKNLYVAEIVSFFTDTFYGDVNDKSGKTLYGYNLNDLGKKTQMLQYIDAFSKTNAFLLPQPLQVQQKVDWTVKKNKLIQEFIKKNDIKDTVFFQALSMRIENAKKTIVNEEIIVLNIIYSATFKIRGDIYSYEMSIEDLNHAITSEDIKKARLQSYSLASNILSLVAKNPIIQGVDNILSGKLHLTLKGLKLATWLVKLLPAQQRHFRIGDRTLEEQVLDFKGISINLKQLWYENKGIVLKNMHIQMNFQNFTSTSIELVISHILMFIMGVCSPWKVQSIEIFQNGEVYQCVIEWSNETNNKELIGKVMNYKIIKDTRDLQELATNLRGQDKELFIVNVTSFGWIICWYLE